MICPHCGQDFVLPEQMRRRQRARLGLCVRCANRAVPKRTLCARCAVAARNAMRAIRARQRVERARQREIAKRKVVAGGRPSGVVRR